MMKMRRLLIIFILFTAAWLLGFLAFTYRINHFRPDDGTKTDAVKLLNDGLGDKLFISGVAKETSLDDLSRRGDLSIQSKREITLDKRSTNTVENAIEAAEWIRQNKIKSIRLVTSNYHILRSEQEFRAQKNDLKIILHPVYSENVSPQWWKNLGSFALVASEYNKFLVVWIRSRLGWKILN